VGVNVIYLASDQPIGNEDFMGLGNVSSDFERNNVVIGATGTITGLVFSIRDEIIDVGDVVTGEIYVSTNCAFSDPVATGIIATITGPNAPESPNCCATATGSFVVNQCDLVSVRVTTTATTLMNGAAATIILS
jgi:hypothetical protein